MASDLEELRAFTKAALSGIVFLSIAAILCHCSGQSKSEEKIAGLDKNNPSAQYYLPEAHIFDRLVAAKGILEVARDAFVVGKVSGQVDTVLVKLGQKVYPDQLLAHVQDPSFILQRDLKQAELKKIKRNHEQAQLLFSKELISQTELENYQIDYDVARIALELAEENLKNSRALAPFEGIVSEVRAKEGMVFERGDSLFRITETEPLFARVLLPESLIMHLKPAQRADFNCPAFPADRFLAQISQVGKIVNPASGTVEVILIIIPSKYSYRLGPGMSAVFEIRAGQRKSLALPEEFFDGQNLDLASGTSFIPVVSQGEKNLREVKIGQIQNGWVEVEQGLVPEDSALFQPSSPP